MTTGSFLILKLFISIGFVVALSLVAEHVSPRVAGLLSGYPLGAAIALFFYGIEIGPDFAAQSAVYTLPGLVATLCFVWIYLQVSLRRKEQSAPGAWRAAAVPALSGVAGYLAAAWLLHFLSLSRLPAALLPVGAILVFARLFKKVENAGIRRKIALNPRVLFVRAVCAGAMILAITGAAGAVGTRWAGLFSAFPVTLLPLLVIIHVSHGAAAAHTIIKNFPAGLGAIVAYALTVSEAYPAAGVGPGTLMAFGAATAYLLTFQWMRNRLHEASQKALRRA